MSPRIGFFLGFLGGLWAYLKDAMYPSVCAYCQEDAVDVIVNARTLEQRPVCKRHKASEYSRLRGRGTL